MPKRLWKYWLNCPHPTCQHQVMFTQLFSRCWTLIPSTTWQLSILSAHVANGRSSHGAPCSWISWMSATVASSQPSSHTSMHVICMLRQRGLGNGPSQLSKTLAEQHSEVWLQKCVQYFTTCNSFIVGADARKPVQKPVFSQPLCLPPVPKYCWLLTVYGQDVLQ